MNFQQYITFDSLIGTLSNYRIDSHRFGHFLHYYMRSKKHRIEAVDYQSKKCLDFFIKSNFLLEKRFYFTEECGGSMKRTIFRWNIHNYIGISLNVASEYFDLDFSSLLEIVSQLRRKENIDILLGK